VERVIKGPPRHPLRHLVIMPGRLRERRKPGQDAVGPHKGAGARIWSTHVVNGRMYLPAGRRVIAFDPETG
jgi:hypothetical protein